MRVLYALICEDAEARPDGRIDVHGVFHQLYAPGFPAQQDRMVLVATIEWSPDEAGRNEFRIDLVDVNGTPGLTISGHTDVVPNAEGEAPPQTRVIMPLENVVFPAAGEYEFELHARDQQIRIAPLHLVQHASE